METGEVIKKLRNEKKITQSELGVMLGVNTSSIQKYESGATKNLKLETIRELCHIFDVPPAVFVFPEIYGWELKRFQIKRSGALDYIFKELVRVNPKGQEKIIEYILDILSIAEYRNE